MAESKACPLLGGVGGATRAVCVVWGNGCRGMAGRGRQPGSKGSAWDKGLCGEVDQLFANETARCSYRSP